jgi:hypothetical protein
MMQGCTGKSAHATPSSASDWSLLPVNHTGLPNMENKQLGQTEIQAETI